MDKKLILRLQASLFAALHAEKERSGVPVSEFVRRVVCDALNKAAADRQKREGKP